MQTTEVNGRTNPTFSLLPEPPQRTRTRSPGWVFRHWKEQDTTLWKGGLHWYQFFFQSGTAGHKIPAIENLGVAKACANLPPLALELLFHDVLLTGGGRRSRERTREIFLGPRCNWFHRQRYQLPRQLSFVATAPDPLVGTKSDKQHSADNCELHSESENARADFEQFCRAGGFGYFEAFAETDSFELVG